MTSPDSPQSSHWRITGSDIPHIEIASAVRSLIRLNKVLRLAPNARIVAGDPEKGPASVIHDGNASGGNIIRLNGRLLTSGAPIPPGIFDVLVGLDIHETYHVEMKSLEVIGSFYDLIEKDFANLLEDIILETRAKAEPAQKPYILAARRFFHPSIDPPSPSNLLGWLVEMALFENPNVPMTHQNMLLGWPVVMDIYTELLIAASEWDTTRLRYTYKRIEMYDKWWEMLKPYLVVPDAPQISESPMPKPPLFGPEAKSAILEAAAKKLEESSSEPPTTSEEPPPDFGSSEDIQDLFGLGDDPGDNGQENSTPPVNSAPPSGVGEDFFSDLLSLDNFDLDSPLSVDESPATAEELAALLPPPEPPDISEILSSLQSVEPEKFPLEDNLLQRVLQALEDEVEDKTESIKQLLPSALSSGTHIIIERNQAKDLEPDPHTLRLLQPLEEIKKHRGKVTRRFLSNGQLDRSSIHRIATDNQVFRQVKNLPNKDLRLILLLDASGSMSAYPNRDIYNQAAAVARLGGKLPIYHYSEETDRKQILLRTTPRGVGGFPEPNPKGNTPSGLALATVCSIEKRGLILHFTDGKSNAGPDQYEVWKKIEPMFPGISVLEVQLSSGPPLNPVPTLPRYDVLQIRSVSEFPNILLQTLRRTTI